MNKFYINFLLSLFLVTNISPVLAISPINFLLPDDPNFISKVNREYRFQIDSLNQFAFNDLTGRNSIDKSDVDILQIWNKDQSTLNMLRGFDSDTTLGQLENQLNTVSDDGTRGHMIPTAKLEAKSFAFRSRYKFKPDLTFNVSLPFYNLELSEVNWENLTENFNTADQLTKTLITNNFFDNVKSWSNGLDIENGWKKIGFGDLTTDIRWDKDFPQPIKPILKNVNLSVRAGISWPTGERKNEDQLFSIPLGNDGSTGIIFGGGIKLNWFQNFHGSLNIDFLKLFGSTRDRRIKIDPNQTDLLFLAKVKTRKEWGFTQRYNLNFGVNLKQKYFFDVAYQHMKHNKDKVSPYNNTYSSEVANTAESLQDWTTHNLILKATYRGRTDISFFFKHPFNGRRSLQTEVIGFSLALSF